MNQCFSLMFGLTLLAGNFCAADLRDVIAHPQRFDGRQVDLIGVVRCTGYVYLFDDLQAAGKLDLSKAFLLRQNHVLSRTHKEYREFDRQWVRASGVISSKPHAEWDGGFGLLLQHLEILRDRPAPRIKDPTIFVLFQNATGESVGIDLRTPSKTYDSEQWFRVPAHTVGQTITEEQGEVIVLKNTGRDVDPEKDKPIARCKLRFPYSLVDYQYSPSWSDKRRAYYKITKDGIESVPIWEGKKWRVQD